MNPTQHTVFVLAATVLAGLGLFGWLWFCYMVGRIVRWTYLEKKAARRQLVDAEIARRRRGMIVGP